MQYLFKVFGDQQADLGALLFENDERITQRYRQEGYYLAKVKSSVESVSDGAVSIEFDIAENEKLKLRKISFDGNEAFTKEELLDGFETQTYRWYSWATSWLDNTGTYSEPIFLRDPMACLPTDYVLSSLSSSSFSGLKVCFSSKVQIVT